jgi:hypothetical protein
MGGSRYVLLGLAPPRAEWFRTVGHWANAGIVPAEFIKCLSAEEVRARLAGGRPFSALLVDGAVAALDRDFIEHVRDAGCAVLVVDDAKRGRNWVALGAVTTLAPFFDRKELLDALDTYVSRITRADRALSSEEPAVVDRWRAPLIAITGPGGTGASTVATALSQGLATDVRAGGAVVLADFRHRAELAMLHDARDVAPGVQELVEACRSAHPSSDAVRALTFTVAERGYHLLLGLRRPHEWPAVRPRAFAAALDALRTTFRYVVADVEPDVEGEDETGSLDVEERNTMARGVLSTAAVVLVVGAPGMKGTHSLAAVATNLAHFGVPAHRTVVVVNRAPRAVGRRNEVRRCLEELLPEGVVAAMPPLVFLPERHVDDAFRDAVPLPDAVVAPLVAACRGVTGDAPVSQKLRRPRLVKPGAVGRWAPELEAR